MQPLLGDISRLTFDPGDELNPRWTPDGKWIIFTSTQNGPRNIYRKLANGKGEVEPLLISEESLHVEDVSPDGRFLIFNYYPDQQEPRLALLSLKGDRKRIPFPTTQFRLHFVHFVMTALAPSLRNGQSGVEYVKSAFQADFTYFPSVENKAQSCG